MILAVHFVTGALIATKIQNPILGIFAAFVSHFLIDLLPHREYSISNIKSRKWENTLGDFYKVLLDALAGFFLVLFLFKNSYLPLLGGFFAVLPDGLTFLFLAFPKLKPLEVLHNFHHETHWFEKEKIKNEVPFLARVALQPLIFFIIIFLSLQQR